MRDPLALLTAMRKVHFTPEALQFLVPLLSEGKKREAALRQWRKCAWFAGMDWARVEAGRMGPADMILDHIDAFGGASSLQPLAQGANPDIHGNTFISPAHYAGFRGDTLNF
jgi:hypothetical protein